MKIEQTAGYKNVEKDCIFRHAILTQQEWEKLNSSNTFEDFISTNQLDFISIQEEREIEFLHITSPEHLESIRSNGLCIKRSKEQNNHFIPDLGEGIYVIEKDNETAIDNLKTYLEEKEEDEIMIVEGDFKGKFTRCVWGLDHEEYIVINSTIPEKDLSNWYDMKIEDFLFDF